MPGRCWVHASWVILALVACGDDSPAGGGNAGGAGGNASAGAAPGGAAAGGAAAGGEATGGAGGEAQGGTAAGGEAAGGASASEVACEAYCAASAACDPNPICVENCVQGIDDPCNADWVLYTTCLAETYDSVACKWRFHECEPEAVAVGECADGTVCLSQCEDTLDGCNCTHACVGTDFAWDCTVDGAVVTCACSHDGVATFECSDVMGTCDTLLYAGCCLSG